MKLVGQGKLKRKTKQNELKMKLTKVPKCPQNELQKIKDNNIAVDTLPTGYHLNFLEWHKNKRLQSEKENINLHFTLRTYGFCYLNKNHICSIFRWR